MIKKLRLSFGEAQIYQHYLVAIMDEGITVNPEHNTYLRQLALEYFEDRPFGYITHRINSYAVNPLVYVGTSEISNLAAFAIVSSSGLKLTNVEIEKRFIRVPFKHFTEIESAKNWVEEIISNKK